MTSHFRVCILPGKLPLDAMLFRYPMHIIYRTCKISDAVRCYFPGKICRMIDTDFRNIVGLHFVQPNPPCYRLTSSSAHQ